MRLEGQGVGYFSSKPSQASGAELACRHFSQDSNIYMNPHLNYVCESLHHHKAGNCAPLFMSKLYSGPTDSASFFQYRLDAMSAGKHKASGSAPPLATPNHTTPKKTRSPWPSQ